MKKAKIILSAITVVAVVSGALAFKVRTSTTFYSENTSTGLCTVAKVLKYDVHPQGDITIAYTTIQNQAAPCSAKVFAE